MFNIENLNKYRRESLKEKTRSTPCPKTLHHFHLFIFICHTPDPRSSWLQSDWEFSRSCWRNEKWVLATHYILWFNCSFIRKFFPANMLRKEHLPQFASLRAELKILMITVLKTLIDFIEFFREILMGMVMHGHGAQYER